MLNWWLGKPPLGNNEDGNDDREPPETPAPVFAARALKSALFGTPAPPTDDTVFEVESEPEAMPSKRSDRPKSSLLSPSRPHGILLTPGTATSRRKTVSFGSDIQDKEEGNGPEKRLRRTGSLKSLKNSSENAEQSKRGFKKTPLTKAFEDAREGKSYRNPSDKPRNSTESRPLLELNKLDNNQGSMPSQPQHDSSNRSNVGGHISREIITRDDFDGDVTMDLNEPHSQSGRYWKSEFQTYHQEAQEEMKKLLRYKHMAKNFAKKKDEEVIDLSEKLKEEQQRVSNMEEKLSTLSARISMAGSDGRDDDTPELIKELARQTALALQYKKQVEEFRFALEGDLGQGNRMITPPREKGIRQSRGPVPETEARKKADPEEYSALREELKLLRKNLTTVEKVNQKLQEDNTKLTQELLHADLRLERHLEKCDKRRKSLEEQREKKDDALQCLQKSYDELKERAKSQRRDAEQLLKQRHDQVVELKKAAASGRGSEATIKELTDTLQKKTSEHSRVVAEYEIQIAELKRDVILGSEPAIDLRASIQQDPALSSSFSKHNPAVEGTWARESQIPLATNSISRPSKSVAPFRHSETPTGSPIRTKPPQQALSEIINSATPNTLPPLRTGPVQFTPMATHFPDDSLHSPDLRLPSPEPSMLSVSSRKIHEKNCPASPRPTMINIPSSPPKPVKMRPKNGDQGRLIHTNDNNREGWGLASSRTAAMEDSRTRRTLPPERIAAAKARLEQKMADKKKAIAANSGQGKENVR